MPKKKHRVIEAEIVDENGKSVSVVEAHENADDFDRYFAQGHARARGDVGGILGGILVLTLGFLATLAVILFSVFIVIPLLLLGRLFGLVMRRQPK